ncbi:MAG: hypothetical protein HYX25_00695 [Candidatus Solibacter usitatus]|nr:hypothetical protein [Candidatus Solibacter usitatus]
MLTYIGFDGISTLSEDPLSATAQIYAGQLIWSDYQSYVDVDTAFSIW